MALDFPVSPSVGQVYQDGISSPYQWNGSYWAVITGSTLTITSVLSASYTPSHRRNITNVSAMGYGGTIIVADGRIFAHKSGGGYNLFTSGLYSGSVSAGAIAPGSENITEIAIPEESGSVVEANVYGNSAYALYNNGNLWTWGSNNYGQCGVGHTNYVGLPSLSNTNVSKVFWDTSSCQGDPSYEFLLIQKTDGFVYGTGWNGQGQLGLGDTTNRTSWTQLPGLGQNPKYVGAYGSYVGGIIAQKADGTIVVTGWNGQGELGVNSTTQLTSFTTASLWQNGTSSMMIQGHFGKNRYGDSANYNTNCLLVWLSDGTTDIVMGSGNSSYGGLGSGSLGTQYNSPIKAQLPVGKRIKKIVNTGAFVGAYHALMTDGTVYGWGRNNESQIGNGNTTTTQVPTLIMSGALDILQTGTNYVFYSNAGPMVKTATGYYSWGTNARGDVGDGTAAVRSSPVRVRLPQGVNIKYLGGITGNNDRYVRIAVTDDNKYYCWGYNGADSYYGVYAQYGDNVYFPMEFTPRALLR